VNNKFISSTLAVILTAITLPAMASSKDHHDFTFKNSGTSVQLVDKHGSSEDLIDLSGNDDGKNHKITLSDGSEINVLGETSKQNKKSSLYAISSSDEVTILGESELGQNELSIDGSVIDSNLTGSYKKVLNNDNKSHEIVLRQHRDLSESEVKKLENKNANPAEYENVTALSLAIQPVLLAAAPLPTFTRIRYQTFIADQYADYPLIGCDPVDTFPGLDTKFVGNNRSFNPLTSNNKTLLDFHLNWSTLSTDTVVRQVGETQVVYVDPNNPSRVFGGEVRQASSTGMHIWWGPQNIRNSSAIQVTLHHDITNPFCEASHLVDGIYYDVNLLAYRAGSYVLDGIVRKVPSHEMYIRDSESTSFTTIMRYNLVTFECLNTLYRLTSTTCEGYVFKQGTIW